MLAWRAVVIRAARVEADLVLARHVHRTVEIVAARERAHAAAALLWLSATEADATFRGRSAGTAEAAAAASRIEAAEIVVRRVVIAATEQRAGERARGQNASRYFSVFHTA